MRSAPAPTALLDPARLESSGLFLGMPLRRLLFKVSLVGLYLLLYAVVFVWAHRAVGSGIAALSLVPVVLAAGELGLWAGIGTPALVLLLNIFLFSLVGAPGWTAVFQPPSLALGLVSVLVGAVIGRFSDTYVRIARESEAEKEALESRLGEQEKSQERYRALWEASRDALCLLTPQGDFLEVNQAAVDLFGYGRQELLNLNIQRIYANPSEWRRLLEALENSEEDGRREVRVRILRKDGTEAEWLETDSLWRDSEGQIVGYKCVLADVPEREYVERYRALSEASRDAVCLLTFEGDFLELNQAAQDLFGYDREELLDLNIRQLYAEPTAWQWLGQPDEEPDEDILREVRIRIRRKDGAEVDCLETDGLWRDNAGQVVGYRSVITDLTERTKAEEELRASEEHLRLAMEAARIATWAMDIRTRTVRGLGYGLESMFGMAKRSFFTDFPSLLKQVHQDDRVPFARGVARVIEGKGDLASEIRVFNPKGQISWLSAHARLVQESTGKEQQVMGTFLDVTERKNAEARLEHLGFYDALTDLPNRRLFNERLDHALAQARQSGRLVAVLNLDIDHFKTINDALGHAAGDRLLQEVAERLTGSVRAYDTVARQGGDEFMVLVAGINRMDEAEKIAVRIQASLKEPFYIVGRKLYVSTSIGISVFPDDGDGAEPLVRNADAAMYRVKESGRNGYQFHTSAMYAAAFGRMELESGMRQALERQEFVVYYQPQLAMSTNEIVGAEALVRWQSPNGKLLSPAEFIPLAEQSGLIVPLGEWVLRTACAQFKAWQSDDLPPLRLSVNISARQFQQTDFAQTVMNAVEESGLEPQWLKLEITETTAMLNTDLTMTVLKDLAAKGIEASLDDFGTGHASLTYLKEFPLHALKIDRSFVTDLPGDRRNVAIATAVIGLAHALELEVVAEGVETEQQLDFLRSRDCDSFQGYLFSPPVPADQFAQIVRAHALAPLRKPVAAQLGIVAAV